MADRFAHLTQGQRRAIVTHDRSILVSAAAGSGKTTVLAERCAALVCDLPRNERCGINELLVVTFTDAAAGEMRSRIAAAIRKRMDESRRTDPYLREQLYLLDGASISTIHSFCRTVIQRWFPQAGVDPQAAVLAGAEAQLLREEALDGLFAELYSGSDELGLSFQQLVDDYGAGNDHATRNTLLTLHDYISSLPDPEKWLSDAVERVDPESPSSLLHGLNEKQSERIARELQLQIGYATEAAATIRRCWPIAAMHADGVDEHRENLEQWLQRLQRGKPASWSSIAAEMNAFEFGRAQTRPRGLSDDDKATFDAAKALRDRTKELFKRRIVQACCAFTADEYSEGLQRIAPYVRTLVELVRCFEDRYRDAKDAQAVVDFNDLQRFTLRVLADEQGRPTDVARQLQQQYRHVLVDEFQDIDPLQESILRLVSRESADPPQGNLFTVGDIKQSIYRFRLAEPELFTNRADRFHDLASLGDPSPPPVPPDGELIRLRENFRSRSSIIDAVNLVFIPLMSRSFGGSEYDDSARLVAGAKLAESSDQPMFDRPAVELHLLEPITQRTASHDDGGESAEGDDVAAEDDGEELDGIEREAYLIAERIQEWMGQSGGARQHVSDRPAKAGDPPQARPIEYRDIVILLRSLPHKAAPMADILRRMNIPVRIDREVGELDGTEFNDVLSLLQILDNPQQDIPLAAALRSPVLGERFDESDLLEIRLLDREIPFHAAVVRYATDGADSDLRDRVGETLARIDRYRSRIRQAPVADVLWEIYVETSYLSYVSGLPDGLRRRDHLIRLHDLARQFGQFSKQGLRRFLRFIDDLREQESLSLGGSSAGPEENLVRIMTIHASKGLEFPVVILADLQKAFNTADTRGTVLLDRKLGIALRAADPERRIVYPTLIHQLAAQAGIRESLSEELRVLYVALTRAREHLMLVGRVGLDKVELQQKRHSSGDCGRPIPPLQLETATCLLDWLLPAIGTMPRETVRWPEEPARAKKTLFSICTYDRATTDAWTMPTPVRPEQADTLAAIARLQPLACGEPTASSERVERIVSALSDTYRGLELTTVPARISVSELKRRWDPLRDPDERAREPARRSASYAEPRNIVDTALPDAAQRGTATHRFLQLLDFSRVSAPEDLREQLDAMRLAGRFSVQESESVQLDACAWFLETDLAKRVRAGAGRLRREVAFISRIAPSVYDPSLTELDTGDVMLVRGMVDVVLDADGAIEILDYKTDAVEGDACDVRAGLYMTQIDHYAAAMEAIGRRPVTHRWLVFLHGRRIIDCPSNFPRPSSAESTAEASF